jgi:putative membrane protein
MFGLLIQWILSAIALMLVSKIVPGFYVYGFLPALYASLVIGLLNATLGVFLKAITFPIAILTFGIFLLVINALMILLASKIVSGFDVQGYAPAFWGGVVLSLLSLLIRGFTRDS